MRVGEAARDRNHAAQARGRGSLAGLRAAGEEARHRRPHPLRRGGRSRGCELARLDAEVEDERRGRRDVLRFAFASGPVSTRRSRASARCRCRPISPASAPTDARDRSDYQTIYRPATKAPSPRRPPACISRRTCFARLDARGIEPPLRDPACRRRHLPAGQGRRHRRPPHACRMGRRSSADDGRARSTRRARAGGRIVAVGTTSLRLLESAAGEDGTIAPFRGRYGDLHHPRLPLPRRRCC